MQVRGGGKTAVPWRSYNLTFLAGFLAGLDWCWSKWWSLSHKLITISHILPSRFWSPLVPYSVHRLVYYCPDTHWLNYLIQGGNSSLIGATRVSVFLINLLKFFRTTGALAYQTFSQSKCTIHALWLFKSLTSSDSAYFSGRCYKN